MQGEFGAGGDQRTGIKEEAKAGKFGKVQQTPELSCPPKPLAYAGTPWFRWDLYKWLRHRCCLPCPRLQQRHKKKLFPSCLANAGAAQEEEENLSSCTTVKQQGWRELFWEGSAFPRVGLDSSVGEDRRKSFLGRRWRLHATHCCLGRCSTQLEGTNRPLPGDSDLIPIILPLPST